MITKEFNEYHKGTDVLKFERVEYLDGSWIESTYDENGDELTYKTSEGDYEIKGKRATKEEFEAFKIKLITKDIKFDKAEEFENGYIFGSLEVSIFLDDSKKKAYIFDADECEITGIEVDIKYLLKNESILNQLICEFCDNTKGYDSSDDPRYERMVYCDCEGMNHELQEFYDSINK